MARIEGDAANYTGKNVWGGFEPEHPAQFGGKSYGILSVGGHAPHVGRAPAGTALEGMPPRVLDRSRHDMDAGRLGVSLRRRPEHSHVPEFRPRTTPERATVTSTATSSSRSGGQRRRRTASLVSRCIGRVASISRGRPKDALLQRDAHEFFAGLDAAGEPHWSADIAEKAPVFSDSNGVGWNVSVSYNAGLRRYLLATEHGATHAGKFGLFDAPEPWGPWTTVAYEEAWGAGPRRGVELFLELPEQVAERRRHALHDGLHRQEHERLVEHRGGRIRAATALNIIRSFTTGRSPCTST